MATTAAIAIREEQAAERIAAAAERLGIEPGDLRTHARNASEQLAQILERCAVMLEQAADRIGPAAAPGPMPAAYTAPAEQARPAAAGATAPASSAGATPAQSTPETFRVTEEPKPAAGTKPAGEADKPGTRRR